MSKPKRYFKVGLNVINSVFVIIDLFPTISGNHKKTIVCLLMWCQLFITNEIGTENGIQIYKPFGDNVKKTRIEN